MIMCYSVAGMRRYYVCMIILFYVKLRNAIEYKENDVISTQRPRHQKTVDGYT